MLSTVPLSMSSARDRLLDAAVEAFAEKGFAATTTRDIASRAQMSPAAVYVHHATKEDLLFEVSYRGHTYALHVMEQARASASTPARQVEAMVAKFSRWHAMNSRLGRIVHTEFHALTPEHRALITPLRRGIEHEMQASLKAGIADGSLDVHDVKGTALALLSLSIDLVRWFEPDGTITADHIATLHARLAVKLVTP